MISRMDCYMKKRKVDKVVHIICYYLFSKSMCVCAYLFVFFQMEGLHHNILKIRIPMWPSKAQATVWEGRSRSYTSHMRSVLFIWLWNHLTFSQNYKIQWRLRIPKTENQNETNDLVSWVGGISAHGRITSWDFNTEICLNILSRLYPKDKNRGKGLSNCFH